MSMNPLTIEAAGPIYRWDNGMGDTLDSLVSILEREQDWEDCASFYEACFEGALALVSRPSVYVHDCRSAYTCTYVGANCRATRAFA